MELIMSYVSLVFCLFYWLLFILVYHYGHLMDGDGDRIYGM